MTTTAEDWKAIEDHLRGLGGWQTHRGPQLRHWRIPSPTGGWFQVEVALRPRWCSLAVDRIRTTSRDTEVSVPWFKEHVWPHVEAAMKARGRGYGYLPGDGPTYAGAFPLERSVFLDLLRSWVAQELEWELPAHQRSNPATMP